jgi:hypothetical protein
MDKKLMLTNVRSAKSEVVEAENELESLLRVLNRTTRAEKTTISKALESAFEKLRAARKHLGNLEVIADDKDD